MRVGDRRCSEHRASNRRRAQDKYDAVYSDYSTRGCRLIGAAMSETRLPRCAYKPIGVSPWPCVIVDGSICYSNDAPELCVSCGRSVDEINLEVRAYQKTVPPIVPRSWEIAVEMVDGRVLNMTGCSPKDIVTMCLVDGGTIRATWHLVRGRTAPVMR
jgi:hypothetical protein